MSTKIYQAWRTKEGVDIFDLVPDIRKRGQDYFVKLLRECYTNALKYPEKKAVVERAVQQLAYPERGVTVSDVHDAFGKWYREQAGLNLEGAPWDLDTSITVWKFQGRYYMIPDVQRRYSEAIDWLDTDPRVEEYRYWNNTDRPESISEAEWEQRDQTWEALAEARLSSISITIMSLSWFMYVDPFLDFFREEWEKDHPAPSTA